MISASLHLVQSRRTTTQNARSQTRMRGRWLPDLERSQLLLEYKGLKNQITARTEAGDQRAEDQEHEAEHGDEGSSTRARRSMFTGRTEFRRATVPILIHFPVAIVIEAVAHLRLSDDPAWALRTRCASGGQRRDAPQHDELPRSHLVECTPRRRQRPDRSALGRLERTAAPVRFDTGADLS